MKILFLSRWFPDPANNGSKMRILNLLRGLALHHEITLLSFSDQPELSNEAEYVRSLCSDVHVIPWREFDANSLRSKLGFFNLKPRSLVDTFSAEMAEKISQMLKSATYDLVIASQFSMAAYYRSFNGVPAIFDELELGLSIVDSSAQSGLINRLRRRLTWFKFHSYVSRLLKHFRALTVVSAEERELAVQSFPGLRNATVIPNGIDVEMYAGASLNPKPHTIIFTGSFRYRANYEAMVWFVSNVFPLILNQVPDTELVITGDHLNLPLPSQKNIRLTGYVDDVRRLVLNSAVALAPLQSGGGTRLKVLEAMAVGVPVVATRKGAEGLSAIHEEHLFVTDSPEEFAQHVIKLMCDRELASQISSRAYEFVKTNFSWDLILPRFLQLIEQTVAK